MAPLAAVAAVGTELVTGWRTDTNTGEVARELTSAGYCVTQTITLPDDLHVISAEIARLTATNALVVVTGGLGPTHDDLTREATAAALGLALERDPGLERGLAAVAARHSDPSAAAQVMRQADVLDGATVYRPESGTAPGQVVPTPGGTLLLLPGPPREMRPMLEAYLGASRFSAPPRIARCVGISESDVQLCAQRALEGIAGIDLAVLATPGLVDAVLYDAGAGESALDTATMTVASALGRYCYSTDGSTLAESVIREASARGITIALAESCTGGMIASALTDVRGASAVLSGGIVAYANAAKIALLGVSEATLSAHGSVSAETAAEMASGARERLSADITLATTGVAGPDGASSAKPVGTVWFALDDGVAPHAEVRQLFGDRSGVRMRATVCALDMLRRRIAEV